MIAKDVNRIVRRSIGRTVPLLPEAVPMSRFASRVKRWGLKRFLPVNPPFCSQYGQDIVVAEFLGHRRGGTFLDIGAHDGESFSNSAYFERELGWTGLCIEPNPNAFARLTSARECRCLNAAISSEPGHTRFLQVLGQGEMLSHLTDTVGDTSVERKSRGIDQENCTYQEIEVETVPIDLAIKRAGISQIDFVSIDTEGREYDIAASIDFEGLQVRIVTIENNYDDDRILQLMRNNGFRLIAVLGGDYVFAGHQSRGFGF